MIIEFNWLNQEGVKNVINMVYKILDVIRIIVPIALIVMTTIDITKKVINPEEKEGQKKIMIRAVAALLVFLSPTIIKFTLRVLNIDTDVNINPTTPSNTAKPTNNKIVCSPGYYYPPHSSSCEICLANSYCPGGTFTLKDDSSPSGIYSCGSGYTSPAGAKSFSECKSGSTTTDKITCSPGYYLPSHSTKCEICLANSYCPGGTFMNRNDSSPSGIYSCGNGYSSSAGSSSSSECKKNATPTPSLTSLKITNCPRSQKSYFIGEKVTLKTDIPESFKGEIKWKVDDTNVAKIVGSSNTREADVELLTRSNLGSVWVTVVAGGLADTCYINIEVVKELKIENCPSSNKVFHVGDKINLKSNLPSTYQGIIVWHNSSTPSPFKITPSSDEKEAQIEIVSVPEHKYDYIGLGADSKSTTCKINIE